MASAHGPSTEGSGTRVCGYAIKNSGLIVEVNRLTLHVCVKEPVSRSEVLKGGGARRVRNSNRRGCNLEVCLDRVGESVTERIIISYNTYPWGI